MEKGSVLVVSEVVIDLLIPDHAPASGLHGTTHVSTSMSISSMRTTYRDVNNFEPKGPSYEIIAEDCSPLNSGVCPFVCIGVGNVESRDSYGEDLVGGFRDIPLDGILVSVTEDGGHCESKLH